jgi:hypothetical protein
MSAVLTLIARSRQKRKIALGAKEIYLSAISISYPEARPTKTNGLERARRA